MSFRILSYSIRFTSLMTPCVLYVIFISLFCYLLCIDWTCMSLTVRISIFLSWLCSGAYACNYNTCYWLLNSMNIFLHTDTHTQTFELTKHTFWRFWHLWQSVRTASSELLKIQSQANQEFSYHFQCLNTNIT